MTTSLQKLFFIAAVAIAPCYGMNNQLVLRNDHDAVRWQSVNASTEEQHSQPLELQEEISTKRKILSWLGSYGATGASTYLGFKGLEYLAQKLPVIGEGKSYTSASTQTAMAAITTMCAAYKMSGFTQECFYTMFSNDRGRWVKNVKNFEYNVKHLKEVVREIDFMRKDLAYRIAQKHKQDPNHKKLLKIIEGKEQQTKDLFLTKVPQFVGNSNIPESRKNGADTLLDILAHVHKLLPQSQGGSWDYWLGPISSYVNNTTKFFQNTYDRATTSSWDVQKDDRLVATVEGKAVEDAAQKLLNALRALYVQELLQSVDDAEEYCNQFADNAKIIIEAVLKTHSALVGSGYTNIVKRMQDIITATDKALVLGTQGYHHLSDATNFAVKYGSEYGGYAAEHVANALVDANDTAFDWTVITNETFRNNRV